jgi:hypothetical protein
MAKNYNIQTRSEVLDATAAGSTVAIGDDVASGMTRYVTFVRFQSANGDDAAVDGSKVYLCSCTGIGSVAASLANSSATQKLVLLLASVGAGLSIVDRSTQVPAQPNTEHPLFTIASGKALVAHRASTAAVSASAYIFVQYYDE